MLPAGLTADPVPSHLRAELLRIHPAARTAAYLLVGACSCDLVRPRLDDPIEDERELRVRYQGRKLSRTEIIRELERHRRGALPRPRPVKGWMEELTAFALEHARNAGPTLYFLEFGPRRLPGPPNIPPPLKRSVQDLSRGAAPWLVEGTPVIVT